MYVLNKRALNNCEGVAREALFVAYSKYKAALKHYGIKSNKKFDYGVDVLYPQFWKDLELELKYKKLSKSERKNLESIKELSEPFFLFKALDQINPEWHKK